MSAPAPDTAADVQARIGLALATVGVVILPITIIAVGVAPQGARAAVFLMGLGATATVSIWGGVASRRALANGTRRRARAVTGSIVGFVVGVTAAIMAGYTLVGLAL